VSKKFIILISLLFTLLFLFIFAQPALLKSRETNMSKKGALAYAIPSGSGLFDYSDAEGYVLFVPKNIFSLTFAPVLISIPAVGIKAQQDVNHWLPSAQRKDFVILDVDVDYAHIASTSDVDALYLKIMNIIDSLAKRYPVNKDKLYLAGTSAGGMLAIAFALRYPEKFKAIGVASGAVLRFGAENQLANAKGLRFFMTHGTKDTIIPINMFETTRTILEKNGAKIKYVVYPGDGHPVRPAGYKKLIEWMLSI
jgi:predicted esterase